MRTLLAALLIITVYAAVVTTGRMHESHHDPELSTYVISHFQEDCGTSNAVTAILLNYRMYDTLFEVLILLTAIVGMKQFLPSPREIGHGRTAAAGKPGSME